MRATRNRYVSVLALCAAGLLAPLPVPALDEAPATVAWRVVVHPANPVRTIGRDELQRIYMRRSRFWQDGSPMVVVNLPNGDPLRRDFSRDVLDAGEEELSTWWNRQYFQGVMPPAVLQSSKAVRAFVAATSNAIGYVDASDVDASVAVVEVAQ